MARPNANDLAVLGLLHQEDLHPYEMARRMREWRIDQFTGASRAALYHAVERLARAGLVEAVETRREGRRPERTTYRITEAGREELVARLREMLSEPPREAPAFSAGLTFLSRLEPDDARRQLEMRAATLEGEVAALEAERRALTDIPRVAIIEGLYVLAMRRAELDFVRELIDDVAAGRMRWDPGGGPLGLDERRAELRVVDGEASA
jgi:DNA-binding PadR family transcriptional regulator